MGSAPLEVDSEVEVINAHKLASTRPSSGITHLESAINGVVLRREPISMDE
jgi:hypothetical protein